MKNRTKYIIQRNEYDLMMCIYENIKHGTHCPIKAVSGDYDYNRCLKFSYKCKECIQKWLNTEV